MSRSRWGKGQKEKLTLVTHSGPGNLLADFPTAAKVGNWFFDIYMLVSCVRGKQLMTGLEFFCPSKYEVSWKEGTYR